MEIIDISNKLRDFEEHLKLNRQTIVSAKFGDGKTYFLNQYIERHKDDTFFIVLHPVNYVVSSNEDIFEYIKHDILSFLVKEPEYKERFRCLSDKPLPVCCLIIYGTLFRLTQMIIDGVGQ